MANTLDLILKARDQWSPTLVAAGTTVEKVASRSSRALNVLEAAGRSAGSGFEDLGGVMQAAGIALQFSGNSYARLAGLVLQVGPQVAQVIGAFGEGARKGEEAISRQAKAVEGFALVARQAAVDRAIAEAEAAGQIGKSLELQHQRALELVEEERRGRLDALQGQNLDVLAASEARFQIERAAVDTRLALEAEFAAKRRALEVETQSIITKAAADAATARLSAEGNPLAAIEAERQARMAAIADEQKAATDKIALFEQVTGKATEAAQLRHTAEKTALDQTVTAELEAAEKRTAAIESSTAAAIAIVGKLGSAFEHLGQSLSLAQFVQESANSIKSLEGLKTAIERGDETFRKLGITTEKVDAVIRQLGENAKKAVDTGIVPGAEALDQWATAAAKAAGTGQGFVDLIVKGTTAIANMTQAQQDLVIAGQLQTRSFLDMGREVDALTQEYLTASESLSEYTIRSTQVTGSQKEAETAISAVTQEIERQQAATERLNEAIAAQVAITAALGAVDRDVTASIRDLMHQLSQVGQGATFAFVQDPKLRDQIEQLQQAIVESQGVQRQENIRRLDALLETNKAQLDADRRAADILANWRALDERRNQILEEIRAQQERIATAIGEFQQATLRALSGGGPVLGHGGGVIRAQHGYLVPGSGSGDTVRALLEPGELVVPKDQTQLVFTFAKALLDLSHAAPGPRFQGGGLVGSGGGRFASGPTVNVTILGSATEKDSRRLAREIIREAREEIKRGTL